MEYNDYELVFLAQENNEIALDILCNKYYNFIVKKAKKIYCYLKGKGLDVNDVIQEAMLGFHEAIMGYNQDDFAIFYTFANICIERRLKDCIRRYTNNRNYILNNAVTIDDENNEGMGLYNFFSNNITPEIVFFRNFKYDNFFNTIKNLLTYLEGFVFELKVFGLSYNEIADVLDMDIKDVYNAVGRIKVKINKVI